MTLGSHQRVLGKLQVHITPKRIIEALGPFYCDPAAADPSSVGEVRPAEIWSTSVTCPRCIVRRRRVRHLQPRYAARGVATFPVKFIIRGGKLDKVPAVKGYMRLGPRARTASRDEALTDDRSNDRTARSYDPPRITDGGGDVRRAA